MWSYAGKRVLFITTKNLDYLRNTQEIQWIEKTAEAVTILGSREKSYAKRLLYIYRKLLTMSLRSIDAVFIGFAPQLILPLFGCRFRKKTVDIDFFISVYDTMVCDRKKFRNGSIPAKLCHWVDQKTIRRADHVISDTNAHGDYFASEFQVERQKIETLYLEADLAVYYPRPQEKPAELQDKFIVLYFGSILPVQGVDVIMETIRQLADRPELHFYIIGPMDEKIPKAEAENATYIPWLSQAELATYISRADLCLAGHFNRDNGKANRTIPGKAYIYEAMQKPMILGDNPATHERYHEGMDGITFVEMGNPTALTQAILDCKAQQAQQVQASQKKTEKEVVTL